VNTVPNERAQITRILIVDDDPVLLQALPEMLSIRLWRVVVDCTDSPQAALDSLRNISYDVVLSDIRMPHMDGFTLLRGIMHIAPQTAVILMSGHGDQAMATEAGTLGAAALLDKPLDRDELIRTVKQILKARAGNNQ